MLENIGFEEDGVTPNYDDDSITPNTRVSYPIHHIQARWPLDKAAIPRTFSS